MRNFLNDGSLAAALLLVLPSSLVSAVTFNCKQVVIDEANFDLQELGGPKQVHWVEDGWPTVSNHTFTLDICQNLKKPNSKKEEQCPSGTRVCYTKYDYNVEEDTHLIEKVYPIAGSFETSHGTNLDTRLTRLKNSASHSDAEKEGVRVELNGGFSSESRKTSRAQKAIIEFECDPDKTGLEFVEDGSRTKSKRAEDGEGDGDGEQEEEKSSLRFISYKDEGEKLDVLRLQWKTKHACEKRSGEPSKEAGWGFFTWVFIIVFLVVAAYLIFGSWLNYSRYGARGWDLVPHGDTIRDLPYIIKDLGRSAVNVIQGHGSRGGYSAV